MHGYLSTLINIVQNVQQIVDDLMEYSEDLNRLGQSQFVDQLKDQRAGGAIYDDNMAKLNEFYQLFSRKNLKGMP